MNELKKRILSSIVLVGGALGFLLQENLLWHQVLIVLLVLGLLVELCWICWNKRHDIKLVLYLLLGGSTVLSIFTLQSLVPTHLEQHQLLITFLLVWSVDIGAYAGGKIIGGPKLASRISPNKTWSGLVSGVSLGLLTAVILRHIWGVENFLPLLSGNLWNELPTSPMLNLPSLIQALLVGLSAQGGDLIESLAKRQLDLKDSSNLIPGHGGLWDRLDGVLGVYVLPFLLITITFATINFIAKAWTWILT